MIEFETLDQSLLLLRGGDRSLLALAFGGALGGGLLDDLLGGLLGDLLGGGLLHGLLGDLLGSDLLGGGGTSTGYKRECSG